MRTWVVFDRKTGIIGRKRLATKKEEETFRCNYVVDILDGVTLQRVTTVSTGSPYDWTNLPDSDERVQFIKLFDAIYDADWYHGVTSQDEKAYVEESYIEHQHQVFEQIRKIYLVS